MAAVAIIIIASSLVFKSQNSAKENEASIQQGLNETGRKNDTFNLKNIEMVTVSGGSFAMGSENSEDYGASPVHKVKLSGFNIGKYEITQSQWTAVMGINPSGHKIVKNALSKI